MCRLNLNLRLSLVAFWQTNPLAKSLACLEYWWCSYHPTGKTCWVLVYSALLVAHIFQVGTFMRLLLVWLGHVPFLRGSPWCGSRLPMGIRMSSAMAASPWCSCIVDSFAHFIFRCILQTLSTLMFPNHSLFINWTLFVSSTIHGLCFANCGML